MTKPITTGPVTTRKVRTGPRRGSDASQCSDRGRVPNPFTATRNRAIEDCAKIAERYSDLQGGGSFSTGALARDIAADIRKLATAPPMPGGTDPRDFPWWAFT